VNRPLRVLFVTSTPPIDSLGGALLFHRQFHSNPDYELFVVTDNPAFRSKDYPSLQLRLPALLERIMRTRVGLFVHDAVHLLRGAWIPPRVWHAARQFDPDLVLTCGETSMADLAYRLARRLRLPLVGHFMDWPTYGMLAHAPVKAWASRQFVRRYRRCQLAFGICPEMLEALGPHPNPHVFYPFVQSAARQLPLPRGGPFTAAQPYTLLFAGNLAESYGKSLLQLYDRIPHGSPVKLRIAGTYATWSPEREQQLRDDGVYLGFLKGLAYQEALADANALLVIMEFDESTRQVSSTSYKSKLVDYLNAGRPIVVWAPPYSTAARHARKHGFALVVDTPSANGVFDALLLLQRRPALCASLVEAGAQYRSRYLDARLVLSAALKAKLDIVHAFNPP
jgi:glycosyltransferase involved in cell wall biosynthesis